MNISPDSTILWESGWLHINSTMAFTWLLMLLLTGSAWLITRQLSTDDKLSGWQNLLEVLVVNLREQIEGVSRRNPDPYLPFIGTLFVFILTANLLVIVPGFQPPTGSLSTTTALAICVFVAVPVFGISDEGVGKFLHRYIEPTPLMLPFNLIGDFSRSIALAVRLYGNVMSGATIGAILITLVPFFFPVVMQLLGLVTGVIQAWIFAILATVYIASASELQEKRRTASMLVNGKDSQNTHAGNNHG